MVLPAIILYSALMTFIFFLLKWIYFYASNYSTMYRLPGPPHRNRLVGNISYFKRSPEINFLKLRKAARDYYPIYKIFILHKIAANILTPEDAELVLSNPVHNEKGIVYNVLHMWLKEGLLTSIGKKWQTRRKIITYAFHVSVIQDSIQAFNEEGQKLVEVLKKEYTESYVNVSPPTAQYALNVITNTAMGIKLQFQNQQEKDYRQAVHDINDIYLYRMYRPWFLLPIVNYFSPKFLKECKVVKILCNFTKEVIQAREKNFKNIELSKDENDFHKGKKRLAMLDLLLSAKNDGLIDEKGIQEEVDTITYGGHDTTALTIGYLLMLLACNKDSQERVVQEMHEVLGDLRKKPTYAELQELKFLERCIKETLRLYPVVHILTRTTGEELTTHTGYLLPKNSTVLIHVYDIHHNAEIYPDPEKFDPDRFLPENCRTRHPYSFLGFSAGPRNCLGQKFALLEVKAAICAVIGNFILESIDNPDTIVSVLDLTLRTKEGIKVKLIPRT